MTRRLARVRTAVAVIAAWSALAGAGLAGAAPASGAPGVIHLGAAERVAPGVTYQEFDIAATHGPAHGHLLSVNLRDPRVAVGLVYPGAVGARAAVSALADQQGAVGAVNGDFFNITETQHPGVEPTGASVGPAIAEGLALKSAVPDGQRFGPALPPGTTTEDVIGVGYDRRARLDQLKLAGTVRTSHHSYPLRGLNLYALPVGGIGAYNDKWGVTSRVRATCGTDTDRAAPCSTDTYELTVRHGRVATVADTPGKGAIAAGSVVLVGREAGAQQLRKLAVGDRVGIRERLVAAHSRVAYHFAVGGFPILRDGSPLGGLDTVTAAVRTSAGVGDGGRTLRLLALDGALTYRTGLTISELADTMRQLGAEDAINLDGGGSSTLVARAPDAVGVSVRNHPSGGAERPVPNGIGVFSRS